MAIIGDLAGHGNLIAGNNGYGIYAYNGNGLQVLGNRRLPEPESLADLADRSLLSGNELEDVPAAGFSDGVEWIGGRRCAGHP